MSHKRVFKLLERVDAFWLKFRVPGSSSFSKDGQKVDTHEGIIRPLDHHESFVALEMIDWVDGAIV